MDLQVSQKFYEIDTCNELQDINWGISGWIIFGVGCVGYGV